MASPQTFAQVIQYYFDYVYVVQPDREMVASYGHLFTGGMTPGSFYKVTDNAIPMQEVIFDE